MMDVFVSRNYRINSTLYSIPLYLILQILMSVILIMEDVNTHVLIMMVVTHVLVMRDMNWTLIIIHVMVRYGMDEHDDDHRSINNYIFMHFY